VPGSSGSAVAPSLAVLGHTLVVVACPAVPARRKERRGLWRRLSGGNRLDPPHFLRGEWPELASLQPSDGNARLCRTEQAQYRMADRCAEPLDEMRASLADLQQQPSVPLGGLVPLHPERAGRSVLEPHALAESGQRLIGGAALHLHQVGPRDLEARVEQPVRGGAVVGQQ
jgi:hypothetical protein